MDRRDFVRLGAGAGAGAMVVATGAVCGAQPNRTVPDARSATPQQTAGFRHSVTRWPFGRLSVDELSRAAKRIGIASVELLEPEEWAIPKAHGLACAVGYAPAGDPKTRLTVGWNREANHAWLLPGYERGLQLAAAAGVPQVICFSGNRAGLSDAEGIAVCARGLRQLMPTAERLGVTVIMELLNSKVDHPDYQCDHTRWGAELVARVGSPRFKLLYDVYHMQIMEGDVIRTIRAHHEAIAHYHVAGVPGRHEPDAGQELQYPAIMRAIREGGFQGYVAQEFLPTHREPLVALEEAVRICSV
jgi:hydroxypyruvate isomerase